VAIKIHGDLLKESMGEFCQGGECGELLSEKNPSPFARNCRGFTSHKLAQSFHYVIAIAGTMNEHRTGARACAVYGRCSRRHNES